jgi:hypothetical protein
MTPSDEIIAAKATLSWRDWKLNFEMSRVRFQSVENGV